MIGWHHCLNGHEFEQTPGDGGKPGVLQFMGLQRVEHDLATEQHRWMHGCVYVCTYIYILTSFQFKP